MADLRAAGLVLKAQSRLFSTPCFPAGAGPDYVNGAAAFWVAPELSPQDVLQILHRVEAKHQRTRQTRWAGRTLDLDLIALDDLVLPDLETQREWRDLPPPQQATTAPAQLILPHPRLQDRGFVLVPLAEVAQGWRHPVLQKTVSEMLADLPAEATTDIRLLD